MGWRMVWGGSTHRIISARQDAFVRSQPGQIKLEILRFQKRRRMGNGNGILARLLLPFLLCCCALNMNAKWIVNRERGVGLTRIMGGWVYEGHSKLCGVFAAVLKYEMWARPSSTECVKVATAAAACPLLLHSVSASTPPLAKQFHEIS